MLVYIYETHFQGFLTAIYEAFYGKETPAALVSQENYQPGLLDTPVFVVACEEKARRVHQAIREKIGPESLLDVYYVFLSNHPDKGIIIFEFLRLAFSKGRNACRYLTDPKVKTLNDISRKVGKEKHRMEGLLRFSLLDNGIYYAPMEPDHDIAELLAPHFSRRLSDQLWMIHDISREKAVMYNKKEWISTPFSKNDLLPMSHEEYEVRAVWQKFFHHIAISERKNPELQKNFMPKRYWKYLTEMHRGNEGEEESL